MCVLSLSCFLGLPILGFRHVTRRSCSSTKQYNSPPPPTPLNLYKKSYVAQGDNRWICSCHPTWPHGRQRTIKLTSKGKAKAQGAVYVSKMLRPTFPYQRYLAPFMMVNRPARGLQLRNQTTKTFSTNYWAPKGPNQRKFRRKAKGKASSVYSQPQWRIQGRGPRGPSPPPPPAPYLKVQIRYWACTHAVFTQWNNPKEENDQMTQKLKRRLRQLFLAILDLHN